MVKRTAQVRRRRRGDGSKARAIKSQESIWQFPLTKRNFLYFGIAIGVLLLGFALMATGISSNPEEHLNTWNNPVAIIVAPILLVIAYCVLIPLAIMKKEQKSGSES